MKEIIQEETIMEDKRNENQVPELRDALLDAVVGGKGPLHPTGCRMCGCTGTFSWIPEARKNRICLSCWMKWDKKLLDKNRYPWMWGDDEDPILD